MIEILRAALFVIGLIAYLGIVISPALIAEWRENDSWALLLILTIPIGLGALIVVFTCWDLAGWIGINC